MQNRIPIAIETLLFQEGTTQEDPLAMAIYAMAITPLIQPLNLEGTKQVWFADDTTAGKWEFLDCTIPNIADLLQPLEDAISQKFLQGLTGQNDFNDLERDAIALPVCLGELGIVNPCKHSTSQYSMLEKVSAPLVACTHHTAGTNLPDTKAVQTLSQDDK